MAPHIRDLGICYLAIGCLYGIARAPADAAQVSSLPETALIAHTAFSSYGSPGSPDKATLNDGNLGTINTYWRAGENLGMGYYFGGYVSVDSFRLVTDTSNRHRPDGVTVYYNGGSFSTNLSNVADQTVSFNAVLTDFVFIRSNSDFDNGGYPDAAITEFAMYSPDGVVTPRTNLLANLMPTSRTGWTDNFGSAGSVVITDNALGTDENNNSASVWMSFDPDGTGADNSIVYDLGSARRVSVLGVDQTIFEPINTNYRPNMTSVRLMFAADPGFTTELSTVDLTLPADLAYQQVSFAPLSGRYFRFSALQRETGTGNPDLGLRELQLFEAPPAAPGGTVILVK